MEIEIRLLVMPCSCRHLDFIAEAEIQRQLPVRFPVVLHVHPVQVIGRRRKRGEACGASPSRSRSCRRPPERKQARLRLLLSPGSTGRDLPSWQPRNSIQLGSACRRRGLPNAQIPDRNGMSFVALVHVGVQAGIILGERGFAGVLCRSQGSIGSLAAKGVPKLKFVETAESRNRECPAAPARKV